MFSVEAPVEKKKKLEWEIGSGSAIKMGELTEDISVNK